MVNESVVVQRGDKLVALVYPDLEEAQSMGMNMEEINKLMLQNLQALNNTLPNYCKISTIEVKEEEFEKTPKKSIKRYLYQ